MTAPRTQRTRYAIGATIVAGTLLLAAGCGSNSSSSGASKKLTFTGLTSNQTPATTLKSLASGACASTTKSAPLSTDTVAQATQDQKLQLLAGQDALPSAFIAPNSPSLAGKMIKQKQIVDVSTKLGDTASSEILPAAASTVKAVYGTSDLYALPNEFNIEGIWYNKKIFAANNLSVPTTWDELVADMAKLKKAGVQPMTADGKDGWPVTRWVGAYLFRDLGPDAMKNVADGSAKLTDPKYVKAADAVSALGKNGYFGANVASNDYNGTINDFLSGKAAMIYMGSWMLSNINDATQNKIGLANVGFMKFPAVTGGAGSIDQIPANVGQPMMFSTKQDGPASKAWMTCIAEHYGDEVMAKSGVVSGFKLHQTHKVSSVTATVQSEVESAKTSVLWFEALFSAKATTVSQSNGGLLGRGALSGSAFMSKVQASLG